VIIDSLKSIKTPNSGSLVIPSFLLGSKPDKAIKRASERLSKQSELLKSRTARLLLYPSRNDPVYRTLQRLFKSRHPCHLVRGAKIRSKIRELANKRFILGYPPRKDHDNSIGDAINWEWLLHCATSCTDTDDVVIVSRDSDYGVYYNGHYIIDDWLRQEFKERVSHKRSITLTNRLTEAFKQASIKVSKAEEAEEESFLEILQTKFPHFDPGWDDEMKKAWFENYFEVFKTNAKVDKEERK
jgi:hypothetical protein